MRHPKTDAMELQMEALLRSAAAFEPELEAPFDLVERAMWRATRQVSVVRVQRPIVALLWGGAAGAAAASAAAAFLITSPTTSTGDVPPALHASVAAATSALRVPAGNVRAEAAPPVASRRSVRVRRTTPRAQLVAHETPAPRVAWQTEEVEHTIEHAIRPALRLQLDENGQPVDLQAGLLETLTVSENPAACGQAAAEGDETGDGTVETSGASRSKEANLPSTED